MASENLNDKKIAEQLAKAFMHLSGFSGFRKLNALTEVALENSVIGEIDWEKIVAEGSRNLTAAPKALSVLKKEKKFYKDLQDFLGKPGKTINDEMTRYLNMMSSQLPRKATSSGYQYSLGADTGVSNDFAYLRREEHRQAELNRFLTMVDRDIQSSSLIGDDNQYALGADTGVRDDFAYLRKEERRQAERNRFRTMMNRDIRSSLSVGDDDQYAFGADTGVRDDFAYLREEERQQNIRNSRWSAKSRRRRANLMRLNMDEYDLFIHDNRDAYGGRAGADAAFRQKLLKDLPPFFKDSKLSTKQLIAIQKSLTSLKSTPIIGRTLGKMVENPVAGVSAAIYGAIVSAFAASDKANATVTGWQNAVNLYGMPSKEFQNAAYLAGLKDPGEISRLYGKLTTQFGDPEAIIYALGSSIGGMSARERTFIAKDLGIDETTMALIDIMSKSGHLTPDQSRRIAANKKKVEVVRTLGFTSESGMSDFMESTLLSIPGMSGAAARDMESLEYLRKGYEDSLDVLQFENIQKNIRATGEAAGSLDEAERQGDTTMNSNIRNSAIYISNMNVQTNDPKAFSEALDGMANGDNRGLLATSGNYVLA